MRPENATLQIARVGLALILGISANACTAKESDFFAPQPIDATTVPDDVPPVFSSIKPVAGATVLNSNALSFTLVDAGKDGSLPSGLDATSVLARLANGVVIPLTASGANYVGSFSGLNDGVINLTLSAKDIAGNVGTAALTFTLDRIAPLIGFTTPSAQSASSEDSVLVTIAGTIGDAAFASAQLTVTQPGADGVCGNADDVPWPKGNAGDQVSENAFAITSQVQANGRFTSSFLAYNGAPTGGSVTAVYCGVVDASDSAKDENGAAKPNRATSASRSEIAWSR